MQPRPSRDRVFLRSRDRIETDQKEQVFMIYLCLRSPKYHIRPLNSQMVEWGLLAIRAVWHFNTLRLGAQFESNLVGLWHDVNIFIKVEGVGCGH